MRPPIFCAGVSSVELGADCEVAVADVSFMAMAGAPGASRALSTTIGRLIEPFITRPLNEREKEIAPRGHHEPAEPRKRKKEGRKATSQKQNNLRIFNGSNISNISNISSVSNRYSGYIGNQMLFGWVTQVALSLGIHLTVAGGSRPTLSFLGPSHIHAYTGKKKKKERRSAHKIALDSQSAEPRSEVRRRRRREAWKIKNKRGTNTRVEQHRNSNRMLPAV